MTEIVYRARPGAPLSDKDASKIGQYVMSRFGDVGVTAEQLVDSARAKRSPVHGYFEWDDARAADEHRLEQARKYLRSIEVVVQTPRGEEQTRAFHVVTNGERIYKPQEIVWSTPDYRQQVIERARREAESWVRRYQQYEELGSLTTAIREALPLAA